jgi:heme/copper-type cytochrome/quinol oxidase subunit 2
MISLRRRHLQWRESNLWMLIVPPTVWALHFLLCYVYAAIRCAKSGRLAPLDDVRAVIVVVTVVALLIVLLAARVAWAQMRVEGAPPPHDESTLEDRHRFLATAKLLLAGLSFVAIVYTAIPAFIFADCR